MMKIMNKLKGSNKILHSKYGNMLFVGVFLVAVLFLSVGKSLLIAAIALGLIGLCKELYDKYYIGYLHRLVGYSSELRALSNY